MLLSGAAGLGWQVVWTAQFGAGLGHEIVAVLAVLAAFFGGLALGAWALGRTIAASRFPGRWYAACEALLMAWGGLLAFHGADGNVAEAFTPRFNTLNLLKVPTPHSVTQVALSAAADRISVTGWLRGR